MKPFGTVMEMVLPLEGVLGYTMKYKHTRIYSQMNDSYELVLTESKTYHATGGVIWNSEQITLSAGSFSESVGVGPGFTDRA